TSEVAFGRGIIGIRHPPCRYIFRGLARLAALEQFLPAAEHRLKLVAGAPVRLERLDVGPVVGELALQLGERFLAHRDLGLELLELARPHRTRLSLWL